MADRTVLVVDGDAGSAASTASAIRTSGIRVIEAHSGREALGLARSNEVDLVLAEAVLPDVTGLGLLRWIREADLDRTRVLLLSRWTTEVDRLIAFESGVDDFVPRPYSASELAARVRAILRRSETAGRSDGPVVSRPARPLDRSGRPRLHWERPPTPKELRLVEELAGRGGRVISRRDLLRAVWGAETERSERVVDAHVKAIRAKLGAHRDRIETVRGVGYRFREVELRPVESPAPSAKS